jgi:hypothetical protein
MSPSAFREPAIDHLQPAVAWADMVLADYSKTPAEVAHIKPLLPPQMAPSRHITQTQTAGGQTKRSQYFRRFRDFIAEKNRGGRR